jgi:DNA-binding NarL/FixJ family response regulator
MKRILLVDDHAVVRTGLRQILEQAFIGLQVAEASNSQEAMLELREGNLDAVILDISLPGMSGLGLLKRIRAQWQTLPTLVLSMHPEDQYGIRVLKAGASGYLTKACAPEKLVAATKTIIAGRRYVSPSLAERLVLGLGSKITAEPHHTLSDREDEILRMIASGKTVSEIARELSLSVKTVSTHRSRILAKMHLKNNAELTHYAIKAGLID